MAFLKFSVLLLTSFSLISSAVFVPKSSNNIDHPHLALQQKGSTAAARVNSYTPAQIAAARKIVDDAIAQAAIRNKKRLDDPIRNTYSQGLGNSNKKRQAIAGPPPALLDITPKIADAAALVAEVDAATNVVTERDYTWVDKLHKRDESFIKRAGNWWMGNKGNLGQWPFANDASYQVFRDVTDPKWATDGAAQCVADGKTDCTKAIQNAMKAGTRCGEKCNGSTTKNAILYFPPGSYLISSTIEIFFGTQMIGDPTNKPTIKAAPSFVGLGVFSVDHYVENGGTGPDGGALEWYINTANFYRQIRNFRFDITDAPAGAYVAALHYQIGQATSLTNIDFIAAPGTTQQGIFCENGSGGQMSDLTFTGGNFGIYGGSQQFTSQRMSFNNVNVAVQLIWDWGWTWKSITITGGTVGFKLMSEDGTHHTGSLFVIDSVFSGVGTAILTFVADSATKKGTSGLTLDNIAFNNVGSGVKDNAGKEYLPGGTASVATWALGPVYLDPSDREFTFGETLDTPRIKELLGPNTNGLPTNPYFERKKPQYEDTPWSSFISVKASGAKGDGVTDDTSTLQNIINGAGSSIVYVDAGSYIIKDTLFIPKGTRIVGECWSQLMGTGSGFNDAMNPKPLLKIGNAGDVGSVELQDLLITSQGQTSGLIGIEWNIKADGQGTAGMWDVHTRFGGATGTDLTSANCPTTSTNTICQAGSMQMHITPSGSAYLENVWLWVADHDIDDALLDDPLNGMPQCSIFVARGFLIESTNPSWLYGTASEHAVTYQYSFYQAKNLFAGMIQTESPYYQPKPQPPAPFDKAIIGKFNGDPDYTCANGDLGCDSSWAVRFENSKDIFVAGAGLYSWFTNYDQSTCIDAMNCQQVLLELKNNYGGIRIHNLITIGATNMLTSDGTLIKAVDNQNVDYHPKWSQVTVFAPKINIEPKPPSNCKDGSSVNPQLSSYGAFPPNKLTWPKDGPGNGYIGLINGSPYLWKNTYTHSYQMDQAGDAVAAEPLAFKYQFADVPVRVDDKGEMNYDIQTENGAKQFSVWARIEESDPRHDVWHLRVFPPDLKWRQKSNGQFDFQEREGYGPGHRLHPYVITGSESYGYYDSTNPPVGWMGAINDIIGERKLKHICMPGSHDAGMYKLDGHTTGSTVENTQTQILSIYNQLRRGSRYFDIRPVIANADGDFYCGHYSTVVGFVQGANGAKIQEVIDDTNQFLAENPDEIVIHYISHDMNTNKGGSPPKSYPTLTSDEYGALVDKFKGFKNLCANLSGEITEMTVNDLKGCVLVISERSEGDHPELGIYHGQFDRHDQYSETSDPSVMANGQLNDMKAGRNIVASDADRKDQFWLLSWTLTLANFGDIADFSILGLASDYAYDSLFWKAYYEFTPYSFPSVLYVDAFGFPEAVTGKSQDELYSYSTGELVTLAMAVNLAVASKNCYIGGGTIWPGESAATSRKTARDEVYSNHTFDSFPLA